MCFWFLKLRETKEYNRETQARLSAPSGVEMLLDNLLPGMDFPSNGRREGRETARLPRRAVPRPSFRLYACGVIVSSLLSDISFPSADVAKQ